MSKYLKNIFFYHTPLSLAKELYNSNQNINDETVKHINDAFIELKKYINKKILKMKLLLFSFNNQQKGKGRSCMLASCLQT